MGSFNTNLVANTQNALFTYVSENIIAIPHATAPASFDCGTCEAAVWRGRIYSRQPGYTGTVDNVVAFRDSNGVAFVNNEDVSGRPTSVINAAAVSPPRRTHAVGDSYLITGTPTGAWAGQPNMIARWTRGWGWEFIDLDAGAIVYDRNTDSFWWRTEAGPWSKGIPAETIADGSIRPQQLENPGFLAVNGAQRSPPPSPADGDVYVVLNLEGAPTGAWSGQDNKLAFYNNSQWSFEDPVENTTVRRAGETLTYDGSSWSADGVDAVQIAHRWFAMSPAAVTPAGQQPAGSTSRTLFTYSVPQTVRFLEVNFNKLNFTLTTSINIRTWYAAFGEFSRTFESELILRVGAVDVYTTYHNFVGGNYDPAGQERTSIATPLDGLEEQYIDMNDYALQPRRLSCVLRYRQPGPGYLETRAAFVKSIRNVDAASGSIIVKGFKE